MKFSLYFRFCLYIGLIAPPISTIAFGYFPYNLSTNTFDTKPVIVQTKFSNGQWWGLDDLNFGFGGVLEHFFGPTDHIRFIDVHMAFAIVRELGGGGGKSLQRYRHLYRYGDMTETFLMGLNHLPWYDFFYNAPKIRQIWRFCRLFDRPPYLAPRSMLGW